MHRAKVYYDELLPLGQGPAAQVLAALAGGQSQGRRLPRTLEVRKFVYAQTAKYPGSIPSYII